MQVLKFIVLSVVLIFSVQVKSMELNQSSRRMRRTRGMLMSEINKSKVAQKNTKKSESICPKAKHNLPMINTATRPYLSWLESGKKTAEGRVNGPAYQKMRVGDSISFCDKKSGQYIYGVIKFKHEYTSFQEMLSSEGVSNMLPFLKDSELTEGVRTYNRFPGASRVNKFGCVAIGISVTKSNLSK
jgi:ASC-1-like (ASCH) protein